MRREILQSHSTLHKALTACGRALKDGCIFFNPNIPYANQNTEEIKTLMCFRCHRLALAFLLPSPGCWQPVAAGRKYGAGKIGQEKGRAVLQVWQGLSLPGGCRRLLAVEEKWKLGT